MDIAFYSDRSIVSDNDEANQWLSTDDRVYWHDCGEWRIYDGYTPQEIADDARADGFTVEFKDVV